MIDPTIAENTAETQTEKQLTDFQQAVYDGLEYVDPRAAFRYKHCGDSLGWVQYCDVCADDRVDFYARQISTSCMLRICADCSQRIAKPIRDHYRPIIEYLFNHCRPGWTIKHIVLTRSKSLSDGEHAGRETLDMAMEFVRKHINIHKGAGAIATLEAGEHSGHWHVHLIAYGPYLEKKKSSRWWKEITGDSFITWIRAFEDADQAISEGLKYATKAVALSPAQLVDLHVELKGTRRVRSSGCFYMSKNNPLKELLVKHKGEAQGCPDCNSKLALIREDEFLQIANRSLIEYVDTAADAVKELRRLRVGFDLIEAIKSRSRGSP